MTGSKVVHKGDRLSTKVLEQIRPCGMAQLGHAILVETSA
jgi:hypothetical protein